MGFAILAWLLLLYLFSSKPGVFACSSSSSSSASSSQGADEHEPHQQKLAGLVAFWLNNCFDPATAALNRVARTRRGSGR